MLVNGILRIDSIYATTGEVLGTTSNVRSVAVDRERDIIYFLGTAGAGTGLHRMNYSGQHQLLNANTGWRLTIDDEGQFSF